MFSRVGFIKQPFFNSLLDFTEAGDTSATSGKCIFYLANRWN